jgi:prepilin-type processing-associated H-X9-DG protein/prepilin-type N-terminal cleavage/methylation domain-containing protein
MTFVRIPYRRTAWSCPHQRGGFTIPEMLAVVAIIVIIISILLPSLTKARATARAAICRSNLHQQGLGLINYTVDSRYYPGAHTWSHNPPPDGQITIIWPARIRQFTESAGTEWFYCPDGDPISKWTRKYGSGLARKYGYADDEVRLHPETPMSYGYNNWGTLDFAIPQFGLGGLSEHPDWGELPKFQVRSPSYMIAIGDSLPDGSWDAFIDHDQPPEYPMPRHPGELANIVFCDGHVEGLTLQDILTPANLGRWNNDAKTH